MDIDTRDSMVVLSVQNDGTIALIPLQYHVRVLMHMISNRCSSISTERRRTTNIKWSTEMDIYTLEE
jgi:hypothetical protein